VRNQNKGELDGFGADGFGTTQWLVDELKLHRSVKAAEKARAMRSPSTPPRGCWFEVGQKVLYDKAATMQWLRQRRDESKGGSHDR
jgi:hypothetical protein